LKRHSSSFHFASQLLGSSLGVDVQILYRFCRYVDDTVDTASDTGVARREILSISNNLRANTYGNQAEEGMVNLMRRTNMDSRAPQALLDAMLSDLDAVDFMKTEELIRYCYGAAGSVGLMLCAVFEVDEEVALHHAIDLGIAMQLTNIARDVAEDASMGRRYLPAEWTPGLDIDDLQRPPSLEQAVVLSRGVKRLLCLAERYYESATSGLSYLPPRVRFAVLVAMKVYREIGVVLIERRCEAWRHRAVVPLIRKVELAISGALEFAKPGSQVHQQQPHFAPLHEALGDKYGANVP
jgi:phytoene synthase